ncbi:MAG TPA: class I SAM-dependent methyltransferase [Longimicrobiales bacterium]|nr:class I SAM-dependent methyltransferase [Longimicrobiales bacterium]
MSILTEVEPDRKAVEAFRERLLEVANHGALALALSVGHRTGLLDALGEIPAGTSREIAERAGLNERYVREWLAALAAGRIVEFDAPTDRYRLPPAHAALLTRRASPHNMAVVMQWIPVLAQVEDRLVESFRRGGGVHYHEYARFHDVMAEMSGETVVAAIFDGILPLAPGVTERLREGIDVLDAGCGQGRALMAMASEFPNSRFRGYDLSADAVAAARTAAREMGLRNVTFLAADLSLMQDEEAYDLVTAFDCIHDQARPDTVLSNIHRALRPGGCFLMQDIATHSALQENLSHPLAPLLYTLSFGHCMSVSLAQGGAGLGTCWGRELAEEMLARAGFSRVRVHRLPHDILNFFYVMER